MIRFFASVAILLDRSNPLDGPRSPGTRWFFETLFDRMCCRRAGTSIDAEAAHRDLNPQTAVPTGKTVATEKKQKGKTVSVQKDAYRPRPFDYCFGGWINLDSDSHQIFSCVLGTHTDEIIMTKANSESGFSTNEVLRSPVTTIQVPPGHIVVFFQRIQHIVSKGPKRKTDSFRQFRCWRLFSTAENEPDPLNGSHHTASVIRDMGVPRLPSAQIPAMYSSNHTSAFLFRGNHNDPITWTARRFRETVAENRVCGSGKNRGRPYRIVPRFFPSLRDFDMQSSYPPYQDAEVSLMIPSRRWEVPVEPVLESVDDILGLVLLDKRRVKYKTILFP
jgi:hypothetical protein